MLAPLVLLALSAAPGAREIPSELEPWVDWVLEETPHALCPRGVDARSPACTFPASLQLNLDDKGGRFTLTVRTYAEATVRLPGDEKRWPLEVKDARQKRIVVEAGPTVRLGPGAHRITGRFRWDALPEALLVPSDVALLSLTVRKKPASAVRAPDGKLYLDNRSDEDATANRLAARVNRRLADGIPLLLTTEVVLEISGEGREEALGPVLPVGFVATAVTGPLPARLDEAGILVVQARPGTHTMRIEAHLAEDRDTFVPQPKAATWADDEVWAFSAKPALRQARLEGISVDPSRTTLPEAWKRLPAYRVGPAQPLKVFTERRGDEDQGSDQLTLRREIWVDFDGKGATMQDVVGGQLNRGWRLEAGTDLHLGRVQVDGRDSFITTRDQPGAGAATASQGVEVRSRNLRVVADSRYEKSPTSIPAVGWSHDFSDVRATLHLPPGLSLIHVSGVDSVSDTWVKNWSMLDLFLALLLTILFWRMWGALWGVVAAVGFALLIPESPALCWTVLIVLVPEALLRVVPKGVVETLLRAFRLFLLVGLVLGSVGFAAQHVRLAMYPALEHPHHRLVAVKSPILADMVNNDISNVPQVQERGYGEDDGIGSGLLGGEAGWEDKLGSRAVQGRLKGRSKKEFSKYRADQVSNLSTYDPKAQVQTGPGLPRWTWNTVHLGFSGPVTKAQRIQLVLLGPMAALGLAGVRVVVLFLLLMCVLGLPGSFWPRLLKAKHPSWTVWTTPFLIPFVVVSTLGLGAAPAAAEVATEMPDPAMLEQLKKRLTAPPSCTPPCATAGALELNADDQRLTLKLDVSTAADVEVTLPHGGTGWRPTSVLVDGRPHQALRTGFDGSLRAMLERGAHKVVLKGPLPRRPSVQIALPLKPHHVTVKARGWRIDGVHEDGISDDTLQLTRERTSPSKGPEAGGANRTNELELEPLVRLTRTVSLGMNWEVFTVVERRSPTGRAIVLEVPSLPGELVTSEGARSHEGKVFVNLAPGAQQLSWRSTLERRDKLKLIAPQDVPWTEVWELEAAPMWHVETKGIDPIHIPTGDRQVWQPWPGESVEIDVTRPAGVEGQTLTIEHVALELQPGRRATDATLRLSMRSSRGDQHIIELPEGAELTSVSIDNESQPIRQDGRKVKLPLEPRPQEVRLKWRSATTIKTVYKTPELDLGVPAVNAEVQVRTGSDRWVLAVRGPRLGPAVLIYSLLFILVVCSVALSRVRSAPPGMIGWLLLGVGLSQVHVVAAGFVAGWLLLIAWRKDRPELEPVLFNLRQITLAGMTTIALGILLVAIADGLLGAPEMQISGNGSSGGLLKWTIDRTSGSLPVCTVVSVPSLAYRLAMLLWSLWLAFAVFGWLKQGWTAFADGGFTRSRPKPAKAKDAVAKNEAKNEAQNEAKSPKGKDTKELPPEEPLPEGDHPPATSAAVPSTEPAVPSTAGDAAPDEPESRKKEPEGGDSEP